ncbi:MAG: sugar phosphate nucleotidyltransferase [Alphaproteobacteria bacterium]
MTGLPRADELGQVAAAILAGGLGTRLAQAVPDRPKALALVGDRAFLDHLLAWLEAQGVRRVVLCLGFRADQIEAHIERSGPRRMVIATSVEREPLGTAGALAHAAASLDSDPVMVINGDSFVDVDLRAFLRAYHAAGARAALVAVEVPDAGRYGGVDVDANARIVRFQEKAAASVGRPGLVSAGIYLFRGDVMRRIRELGRGSLERDILEREPPGTVLAFRTRGRFVDIGTPEGLATAGAMFAVSDRTAAETSP